MLETLPFGIVYNRPIVLNHKGSNINTIDPWVRILDGEKNLDPGSEMQISRIRFFFEPWIQIRDEQNLDPGSEMKICYHTYESFVTFSWAKYT